MNVGKFFNAYDPSPLRLPKVRSAALIQATHDMPCSLRLASLLLRPCEGDVMAVHLDKAGGKGMGTKVSDLAVVAGCNACHCLLDGRDRSGWSILMDKHEKQVLAQCIRALLETQSRWVALGLITGPDWAIVG